MRTFVLFCGLIAYAMGKCGVPGGYCPQAVNNIDKETMAIADFAMSAYQNTQEYMTMQKHFSMNHVGAQFSDGTYTITGLQKQVGSYEGADRVRGRGWVGEVRGWEEPRREKSRREREGEKEGRGKEEKMRAQSARRS